nr:hypothetical protein [Candidatus Gracilibacteria bacterium]
MRKFKFSYSFFYFLFFVFYFSFVSKTNAFLDSDLGLDLYKNIDKGIYDLELKNYEFEMTNGGNSTISERINNIAGNNCIGDISIDQVEKIANGDLVELNKVIKKECKTSDGNLTNSLITGTEKVITEVYNETKKQAEEKAKTTYNVSRIGLYSDGDVNNSPFDLIKDMEDINTVIFASENKYVGVESYDNGNPLSNLMNGLGTNGKTSYLPYAPTKLIPYTGGTITPIISANAITGTGVGVGQYVCADTINDSGLDSNVVSGLIGGLTGSGTSSSGNLNLFNQSNTGFLTPLLSNYSKVNDNSIWKCDSFFCIVIDFVMYNHKLLGGGQNISIESILAKSNDHIHKFTNTSMLQKKMSINDWELSLKNLNLPSIFNLNFIIYKKSPPILNVDKKEKQEDTIDKNSPLWRENLAYEYYKNSGLDYKNANSMQNLKKVIEELKCTQDSGNLTVAEAEAKCNQYKTMIQKQEENNIKIENISNELVKKGDLNAFYDMFVELQIFTKAFENYVNGTRTQVIKMDKKPTG